MTKLFDPVSKKLVAPRGVRGKELLTQFNRVFPKETCLEGQYYNPETDIIASLTKGNKLPKPKIPVGSNDMTVLSKQDPSLWKEDYRQVVSIDPALVNLAIRIEKRPLDKTQPITMVHFDKVAVANVVELQTWLMSLDSFFSSSHIFLIERQLIRHNPNAGRIFSHLCSFFMTKYTGLITEVDPKLKSKILKAPKGVDLKKWSVEEALKILKSRDDMESIKIIEKTKKKDDLADTVCQSQAWWQRFVESGEVNVI